MSDDPPIYAEMLDKARRAKTTAPEGTALAMAWAPDARGRVVLDWTPRLDDRPDRSWCEDRPVHALSDDDGVD